MARGIPFCTVDVFSESKYAGNQLAVITDAKGVSDAQMQSIAKETNFSETAFVMSATKRNGGYDVRIFTPKEEVPFAGHPTLGTAFVIQQQIVKKPVETIVLNLKVGQVPVTISYRAKRPEILWMKQVQPTFGKTFTIQKVAEMLNIGEELIDQRFPSEEVSTGLPHIMVPLKSLEAVRKAKINREKYFELIRETKAKAVFVFCEEAYNKENRMNARQFADYYGIAEDPATGSANGCLAAYLVKHRVFNKQTIDHIRVEQGYEIGRPSLILLRDDMKNGRIDVWVGGKAIMIAKVHFV